MGKHTFQRIIPAALCTLWAASVLAGVPDAACADTDSLPDIRVTGDTLPVPSWKYVSDHAPTMPDADPWWRQFNDPMLDELIATACDGNYDLSLAMRRMELSRLQMKQAESAWYPTVSAQAGWTKTRTSAREMTGGRPVTDDFFSLGLSASWEIDVFGRIRDNVQSMKKSWQASQEDYTSAQISLCAQLSSEYVTLRAYQAQLEVARRLSAEEDSVLDIAVTRHECALASGLDVSQARTVLYSTQASVPALETSVATTINAILLLLGSEADTQRWTARLAEPAPIPMFSGLISAEIPLDLLRRRPDVAASEYRVAALAAATGVARKDFLPTLAINASVGTAAHNAGDLFSKDSFTYTIAPTLTWTVFSGFSRKYALAEAKVQTMEAIDSYNYTLQSAVSEVNNAITTYRNALRRTGMLNNVLAESRKSFDYSLDQYRQGLSGFLNLLNSQIDLLNYNNSLIQEQMSAQLAVISLYRALGGGWE